MRACDCKVLLLYATATIFACISSTAEARYWRHYGYHWYGRTWNGSRPAIDERQVEKQPLGTEPGNDPRQVGDFGAAIEQMIHACDRQVAELKDMPLDAVAQVVNPTSDQREALDHIRSVALDASESLAAACVNAGSNVPKCAEVKILSWAGFSVISRLDGDRWLRFLVADRGGAAVPVI